MDPVSLAHSIYQIAMQIKQQVDLAKSNKSQFRTLYSRVNEIIRSLQGLETLPRTKAFYEALTRLKDILEAIFTFTTKFEGKKWYQQIIRAGNNQSAFQEYNTALKEAMEQLNLGLNVQQLMNAEQDRQDQAADNQEILAHQAEILALQQEEKALLLDMKMAQAQKHQVLELQLKSLAAHLQKLAMDTDRPGSPKKAMSHLKFSFHELNIHHVIGKGSFGTIYYGEHMGRSVAVKMIEANVQGHLEEFHREIQIMERLRAQEVVQLFGYCQEPAATCLVMEHMEQGDLYQLIPKKVFKPEEQKRLILEIARGLQYLHSQGVIHRDLKSANILINADDHAKIADFGLSKIKTLSVATAHHRSEAIQWMAPEVRHLNPVYSKASDIYGFGIILWEILTGKDPFRARSQVKPSFAALAGKMPGEIPKELSQVYQDIIRGCWQEDPSKRPSLEIVIEQVNAYQPRPASPDGEAYFEQAQRYEKDKVYDQAYRAYDRASQKGIWKAHTSCALFTLQGGLGGATVDKREAHRRLTLAGEHGHQRAMYNLARMHEKADGIPEDLNQALKWYQKASEFDEELQLTKDAKGKVKLIEEILAVTVKAAYR